MREQECKLERGRAANSEPSAESRDGESPASRDAPAGGHWAEAARDRAGRKEGSPWSDGTVDGTELHLRRLQMENQGTSDTREIKGRGSDIRFTFSQFVRVA